MESIKNKITKDNINTSNVTKDPLWHCKECTGKKDCNQPIQGFYQHNGNTVRCRHNQRGYYNDEKILDSIYEEFSCYNFDEIKELINKYHNLYLYGEQGYGKTHFLYWLANTYNKQGHNVYIAKWSEINQLIKEESKERYLQSSSLRVRLQEIKILFIDDLGNDFTNQESAEILSTVIDHRYINHKPTFITSNYSLQELGKHYTETKAYGQPLMPYHLAKQIVSRLDDKRISATIEIKNKNWRK